MLLLSGRIPYLRSKLQSLQCAAFYLLATCHAIYEEYHLENVHAQSGGNNFKVAQADATSITDYLLSVTLAFKSTHPEYDE